MEWIWLSSVSSKRGVYLFRFGWGIAGQGSTGLATNSTADERNGRITGSTSSLSACIIQQYLGEGHARERHHNILFTDGKHSRARLRTNSLADYHMLHSLSFNILPGGIGSQEAYTPIQGHAKELAFLNGERTESASFSSLSTADAAASPLLCLRHRQGLCT